MQRRPRAGPCPSSPVAPADQVVRRDRAGAPRGHAPGSSCRTRRPAGRRVASRRTSSRWRGARGSDDPRALQYAVAVPDGGLRAREPRPQRWPGARAGYDTARPHRPGRRRGAGRAGRTVPGTPGRARPARSAARASGGPGVQALADVLDISRRGADAARIPCAPASGRVGRTLDADDGNQMLKAVVQVDDHQVVQGGGRSATSRAEPGSSAWSRPTTSSPAPRPTTRRTQALAARVERCRTWTGAATTAAVAFAQLQADPAVGVGLDAAHVAAAVSASSGGPRAPSPARPSVLTCAGRTRRRRPGGPRAGSVRPRAGVAVVGGGGFAASVAAPGADNGSPWNLAAAPAMSLEQPMARLRDASVGRRPTSSAATSALLDAAVGSWCGGQPAVDETGTRTAAWTFDAASAFTRKTLARVAAALGVATGEPRRLRLVDRRLDGRHAGSDRHQLLARRTAASYYGRRGRTCVASAPRRSTAARKERASSSVDQAQIGKAPARSAKQDLPAAPTGDAAVERPTCCARWAWTRRRANRGRGGHGSPALVQVAHWRH